MVFSIKPHVSTFVPVTIHRSIRLVLGYLALVSAQIGVWALLAPRSFYDDFPGLGRAWVAVDGPFNEHLIRDVGALNVALTAMFVAALVRLSRELVTMAGVVALAWGVPHAIYHLAKSDGLSPPDLAASLLGLLLFAAIGGALIFLASHLGREPGTPRPAAHESATRDQPVAS